MIAVVGGGLIGACVAFELSQSGEDVLVFDADLPGAAWRAGAGLLTPSGERLHGTPLEADALESLSLWPDFARRLEAVSGGAIGFREGVYRVALDDDQAHFLNTGENGEAVVWERVSLSSPPVELAPSDKHPVADLLEGTSPANKPATELEERVSRAPSDKPATELEERASPGSSNKPATELEERVSPASSDKPTAELEERANPALASDALPPGCTRASSSATLESSPDTSEASPLAHLDAHDEVRAMSHLSAARFHAGEGRVHPPSVRGAALSGLTVLRARVERIEPLAEAGADWQFPAKNGSPLPGELLLEAKSASSLPGELLLEAKSASSLPGELPLEAKSASSLPDEGALEIERSVERAPRVRLHLDSRHVDVSVAVVCCGAWSGEFGLPVRAVQGQALLLDAPRETPALYGPPQTGSSQYALGRPDGLYIGATSRDSDTAATGGDADAVTELRDKARRLLGEDAARAPLLEHLVGFRPTTPDGLPIIARHPALPNVVVATGHSRHGVLLAPLTALRVLQLVRELLGEHAAVDA